jgi:hypothetical protein
MSAMTTTSDLRPPAELHIQVHPDLVPELDLLMLREQVEAIGNTEPSVLRFKIDEGEDEGRYLNLAFKTSDRAALWRAVEARLYEHPQLGPSLRLSSMTLCTGDEGWDDYLVLWHFNPEFELDAIDEA